MSDGGTNVPSPRPSGFIQDGDAGQVADLIWSRARDTWHTLPCRVVGSDPSEMIPIRMLTQAAWLARTTQAVNDTGLAKGLDSVKQTNVSHFFRTAFMTITGKDINYSRLFGGQTNCPARVAAGGALVATAGSFVWDVVWDIGGKMLFEPVHTWDLAAQWRQFSQYDLSGVAFAKAVVGPAHRGPPGERSLSG